MDKKKKERVNIRKRLMPSGNTSLYLDVFTKDGRKYEYLKLYLVPEHSRADKEKNRQTMQLAEAIRAKRTVEIQNNEYGFKSAYAEETRKAKGIGVIGNPASNIWKSTRKIRTSRSQVLPLNGLKVSKITLKIRLARGKTIKENA